MLFAYRSDSCEECGGDDGGVKECDDGGLNAPMIDYEQVDFRSFMKDHGIMQSEASCEPIVNSLLQSYLRYFLLQLSFFVRLMVR